MDVAEELAGLGREVSALSAKHEKWAQVHDDRLGKIEANQTLAQQEITNAQAEITVVQNRVETTRKRISCESARVDELEDRLRVSEDTGVRNLSELQGREKALAEIRKKGLFALAVLGGVGTIAGVIFGVVKLLGYVS